MKVLKITWKLLLLIIVIAFGLLYYASNKMDNKYQTAISYMNRGDWSNAASLFLETPHYKDSTELYIYVYPNKLYYAKYTTQEDTIKGYTSGIDYINYEVDKLKGTSCEKYYNELIELKKVLNFRILEINAKSVDEPQRENIQMSVDAVKIGSYQDALSKLQLIPEDSIYAIDKNEIIKYIALLNTIPFNDLKEITKKIAELNPEYEGTLASEIKTSVAPYMDTNTWMELYKEYKGENIASGENNTNTSGKASSDGETSDNIGSFNKSINIGMERGEVLAVLGKPLSTNKIENKYGVYEILNYENNRQIFLENNIVTAIK